MGQLQGSDFEKILKLVRTRYRKISAAPKRPKDAGRIAVEEIMRENGLGYDSELHSALCSALRGKPQMSFSFR